jgi:hypothetical protein
VCSLWLVSDPSMDPRSSDSQAYSYSVMKRIQLLAFFSVLLSIEGRAQWQKQVGINVVPLLAQSLEATSEFSHTAWYSLSLDVGYTYRSRYKGIGYREFHDGHNNRTTSGVYARFGPRFYTPGFGPSKKVRFYVNPLLVFSSYRQQADFVSDVMDQKNTSPVSARGAVLIPALRVGLSRPVSKRMVIDFGAQKARKPGRDDLFGSPARNYQPGTGAGERFFFNRPYLQGYFALKWRI